MKVVIREKPWDLVVVMILAILLLIVILIIHYNPLLIVFGLIFVLFLPGYVIVSALFPKAEDLEIIERIALSFGLSIAVIPLIGLLLNFTSFGIRLFPIFISLFILIFLISIIAWYRRNQVSLEDRFYIIISIELPIEKDSSLIDKILTILLVISIIIAASVVLYVITTPKEGKRFTEFYILNYNRSMENYPTNLSIGENGTIIIGVVCHEYKRTKYTIEIELINLTGEKENRTLGQNNFTLKHNQINETVFQFKVNEYGIYKLQFVLYINEIEEPYRTLHLWINIKL